MKLYDLIKDKIKDPQGVISDNEMCVLNRRDFLYSETSTSAAFLRMFGAERVTYEMYAIIDFIHASVCKVRPPNSIRVFQLSQSMTLPALAVSALVADQAAGIRIHAPRGIQKVAPQDAFALAVAKRFEQQVNKDLTMSDLGNDEPDAIDIVFCNASSEAEVSSGLKSFEKVRRGFILIKGYGRNKAPNCGEIILSARLNVHCSLAGFGFCSAL
jgi:hypothetical protein